MSKLDLDEEVNMINDLEFAFSFGKIIEKVVQAIQEQDKGARIVAENQGRQLFHEHRMKYLIYKYNEMEMKLGVRDQLSYVKKYEN